MVICHNSGCPCYDNGGIAVISTLVRCNRISKPPADESESNNVDQFHREGTRAVVKLGHRESAAERINPSQKPDRKDSPGLLN